MKKVQFGIIYRKNIARVENIPFPQIVPHSCHTNIFICSNKSSDEDVAWELKTTCPIAPNYRVEKIIENTTWNIRQTTALNT